MANQDTSEPAETHSIPKPANLGSDERSVSFSSIEIREYPLCMGDNPGCLRGVPISIDWEYSEEKSLSLDEYEESRGEPSEIAAIPPHKRFEMLQGTKMYTRGEIMKTLQKVEADRERRKTSSQDSEMVEYIESLKRGLLNKTIRRNKKKKERELLFPYLPQGSLKKRGIHRSLSIASTSCESTMLDDDHLSDLDTEAEIQELGHELEIQS